MRILVTILIFFTTFLNLESAIPPPPGVYFELTDFIRQQMESTNIVLNPNADKVLKLRIKKDYEIFDSKGKLVLKGTGKEIDISDLAPGKYTIKFDKDYNQIEYFTKK
jgi:hypothetical protein